jgi:hypothetical protein
MQSPAVRRGGFSIWKWRQRGAPKVWSCGTLTTLQKCDYGCKVRPPEREKIG